MYEDGSTGGLAYAPVSNVERKKRLLYSESRKRTSTSPDTQTTSQSNAAVHQSLKVRENTILPNLVCW